jgi:hypothetical protein
VRTDSPAGAVAAFLLAVLSGSARADGSVIDKVYHPYVDRLTWELEWRVVQEDESPLTGEHRRQLHRLGLGHALSEYVYAEAYVNGSRSATESLELEGFEGELLWQMSEQGEYFLDYGMLFEVEQEKETEGWEYSSTLLLEREFGRLSGTANIGLIYERSDATGDELETTLALQARYRGSPHLEPALELYLGENTRGLGPVLAGAARLAPMRSLRWELGVILGLEQDTPDYTLRALLEYEF